MYLFHITATVLYLLLVQPNETAERFSFLGVRITEVRIWSALDESCEHLHGRPGVHKAGQLRGQLS